MKIVSMFLLFIVSCGHSRQIDRAYVKDPVCGTMVEKSPQNYQDRMIIYDDVKWYFCSDKCAAEFANNPSKYMTTCACHMHYDCDCYHCGVGPIGSRQPCVCKN